MAALLFLRFLKMFIRTLTPFATRKVVIFSWIRIFLSQIFFRGHRGGGDFRSPLTRRASQIAITGPKDQRKILAQMACQLDRRKPKLKRSGYVLYEKTMEQVNMDEFFQVCELPDTFYSWFLVMELHIWMMMVRLMDEGEEGRFIRNSLVEAMWEDVDHRSKKLGASNASARRAQVDQLVEQFQATLFHYDEGLMIDDKALAGALWCHLFSKDCNDPERVECVIHYIRKQISTLDVMSREDILLDCHVKWSPLLEQDGHQQQFNPKQFDPSVFLR
ncbi:unnamed protein product, partial [Meganyctiphanes norvegica]